MKKILLLLFSVFSFALAYSQPYGNEWINYSQPYYKIKVASDGIYRIPYTTLNSSIPGLSSLTGANFTMYHNGVNIPIYVLLVVVII
jgi:hypothetical protein